MMKTEIRKAEHDEAHAIAEFGREFWEQTSYYKQGIKYDLESCRLIAHNLINTGIALLVVESSSNKIVGLLLMVIVPIPFNPSVLMATEIAYYITPKYRKGYSAVKLLKKGETLAKTKGVKYINMINLSNIEPHKVEKLYLRMGYKKIETVFSKDVI